MVLEVCRSPDQATPSTLLPKLDLSFVTPSTSLPKPSQTHPIKMSAPYTVHVLDKVDYSKHRLVTLPNDPLPPLAPSSIRFQSKTLGLTTNNLTYARMGLFMGWYDIYPLPPNIPAPYNDTATYGRVSAWGYAEIIESTVPDIPVGHTIYGYLPTSTLPEDVRVERMPGTRDQIVVLSEHRQHLWKIYNRYQICPPLAEVEKREGRDFLGWDSLMQGLFGTSYNMNKYAFAWEDGNRLHPSGDLEKPWAAEDANLDDAVVMILNASGKTGMAFAHQLRHNRPKEHQPRTVIGIGSPASKDTIEKSGYYDQVVLNTDSEAVKSQIEHSKPRRIVLIDFGAREGANAAWNSTFSSTTIPFTFVAVGGEVKIQHPDEAAKRFKSFASIIMTNASLLREKGIEIGGQAYFDQFMKDWNDVKRSGGIPGITLKWGEGMEALADGWDKLAKDEVPASTGLVFRI